MHEAVVGRRVAVDGRAVERDVGDLARERREQRRGDRRVGRDEREHRRHVGMDHAGALGDAGDGDRHAVDVDAPRAPFGTVSVVMIARAAANQPSARERRAARRGSAGDDPLDRQRLHDHAGRERQHLARARSRAAARPPTHVACASARPASPVPALALPALTTSARNRRRARVRREMLAADGDRRGAEAVLREHAAGDRARRRATTSSTSSRSQFLILAAAVPSAMPGDRQQRSASAACS